MDARQIPTQFAPAEKESEGILHVQREIFEKPDYLRSYLDVIPDIVLVLNDKRQIIFSNQTLLNFLGINKYEQICGLRPGEILNCIHAFEAEGGCGVTQFCRTCGAVKAILASLRGESTVEECRILQKETGEALDLRVWASPYRINGSVYSIFVVSDIRHEKRRMALERIFYHDVLNTAGGLLGFSRLLRDADASKSDMIRERIFRLSQKLIDEIKTQRDLSMAETHELIVKPSPLRSGEILQEIMDEYSDHEAAKDRILIYSEDAVDAPFESDPMLLRRVLGNMVKNALEACRPGEAVTIGCRRDDDRSLQFWVHNPGSIPPDIQRQIFQRSFSTKGAGRGLGSYSMKFLGEHYLKGRVSFTSTPEQGTTFYASFPMRCV
ncbi:MAG: PAS domain-containing sensor histidine kinase [Candidatus Omnitrophica bacterium]|nr:PAS domain-containing sensor histidine kinase [Candidatus Omnitrophota bacterium]